MKPNTSLKTITVESSSAEPKKSISDFNNNSFIKSFLIRTEFDENNIRNDVYMIKKVNPISFIVSAKNKVYDFSINKYLGIEFMIFMSDDYDKDEILEITKNIYNLKEN